MNNFANNSQPNNESTKSIEVTWWLIFLVGLGFIIIFLFLGLWFLIPLLLLIISIIIYLGLNRNIYISKITKYFFSIFGILIIILGLLLYIFFNHQANFVSGGFGADIFEPGIELLSMIFAGIILASGTFLFYSYKDASIKYKLFRRLFIITLISVLISIPVIFGIINQLIDNKLF